MSLGPSAIFFLDHKGKTIIRRDYRGDVSGGISEKFQKKVIDVEEQYLSPVFTEPPNTYVWIKHNNIYIVSVSKGNPNVMLILSFLYKLISVFSEYYDGLTDESMRDNFVSTYELLDEMMDNGYPQITEVKVLKEYITTESNRMHEKIGEVQVPVAASNAQHWRPDNIKHSKNEAYLDVIEKLNAIIASNGTVLSSEIIGFIKINC